MEAITVINPGAIAEASPEQIKPDLKKFDKAKEQVGLVVAELKKFSSIDTKETLDLAMSTLKIAKDVDNAIEKRRTELVKPWNDGAKEINAYVKELIKDVDPAINAVKNACIAYQKEEERKAKQAKVTARQGELAALGFTYDPASNKFIREHIASVNMIELENYDDRTWSGLMVSYTEAIRKYQEQMLQNVTEEQDLVDAFGDEEQKQELSAKIATVTTPPPVYVPATTTAAPEKLKGVTKRWTFDVLDSTQVPREYMVVDTAAIRAAINAGIRTIPGVTIYQSESLTIR
ncbi:MAG TPA: hypothetical protein P5519_12750 [Spirochaetia bacterium]|nr:hypothetical protein [Spirochaetia bacterium]